MDALGLGPHNLLDGYACTADFVYWLNLSQTAASPAWRAPVATPVLDEAESAAAAERVLAEPENLIHATWSPLPIFSVGLERQSNKWPLIAETIRRAVESRLSEDSRTAAEVKWMEGDPLISFYVFFPHWFHALPIAHMPASACYKAASPRL